MLGNLRSQDYVEAEFKYDASLVPELSLSSARSLAQCSLQLMGLSGRIFALRPCSDIPPETSGKEEGTAIISDRKFACSSCIQGNKKEEAAREAPRDAHEALCSARLVG